jgi:hypothetical protein
MHYGMINGNYLYTVIVECAKTITTYCNLKDCGAENKSKGFGG